MVILFDKSWVTNLQWSMKNDFETTQYVQLYGFVNVQGCGAARRTAGYCRAAVQPLSPPDVVSIGAVEHPWGRKRKAWSVWECQESQYMSKRSSPYLW